MPRDGEPDLVAGRDELDKQHAGQHARDGADGGCSDRINKPFINVDLHQLPAARPDRTGYAHLGPPGRCQQDKDQEYQEQADDDRERAEHEEEASHAITHSLGVRQRRRLEVVDGEKPHPHGLRRERNRIFGPSV